MFTRFQKIFSRADVDLDPVELAEVFWLAQFEIAARPAAESEPRSDETDKPRDFDRKREQKPPDQPEGDDEGEANVQLYIKGSRGISPTGTPASEALLPGAVSIPNAAAIGRALRPLARRRRGAHRMVFDEDLTARTSAECAMITPVFSAAPERWFSVALVAEESAAMAVWSQTVEELADLFTRHGGFNEVSQWRLRFHQRGAHLVSHSRSTQPLSRLNRLAERQLIVLLTDGASSRWRDGRMARVLNQWGRASHVVIAQVLGERMWHDTSLGRPSLFINSHSPGSPNRDLFSQPRWPGQSRSLEARAMPFPVVSLNPDLILEWARMLMQPGMLYTAVSLAAPVAAAAATAKPPLPNRPRERDCLRCSRESLGR